MPARVGGAQQRDRQAGERAAASAQSGARIAEDQAEQDDAGSG